MDNPWFWIPVLLGITFVEFGREEIKERNSIPAFIYFAGAFLLFVIAIWSQTEKAFALPPLPRPLPYFSMAFGASLILAIFTRFRADRVLERSASRLATELDEWSTIARARLPQSPIASIRSEEAKHLADEYGEKFGIRIVQLMKPLAARDSAYADLRDTWLGVPPRNTLTVASRAELASKFFRKYGNELPLPVPKKWFDQAFLKCATIYFAGACLLWVAILGLENSVVREDHSLRQATMLNVDYSQSPWLIPIGTNQIFAASGIDRDTELILPAATGSGDMHTIKKIDKNAHRITVTPHSSDTVDGDRESINITVPNDVVRFVDRERSQWIVE